MNEALAYKWARQALKSIEKGTSVEAHKYQQVADKIVSAILEAYKLGASPETPRHEQDNMQWVASKIERKLKMFLQTKDIAYLEKVDALLVDLRNEHDLWLSWKRLDDGK